MSKFNSYKYRAERKGLDFTIPEIIFTAIEQQCCYYCKSEGPSGVDRFDNSKGYVSGNCIPCCWTCNRAKSSMEKQAFIKYLHKFNPNLKVKGNPLVIKWDGGSIRLEPLSFSYKLE